MRGTFGSGGEFAPFDERDDGLDTVGWVEAQPWHEGALGMAGASYLGLMQWAVAGAAGDAAGRDRPDGDGVAVPRRGLRRRRSSLESRLSWHLMVSVQEKPLAALRMLAPPAAEAAAAPTTTSRSASWTRGARGESSPYFREWLERTAADDPTGWRATTRRGSATSRRRCQLIAGWHDIFRPGMLEDFKRAARGGPRRRS